MSLTGIAAVLALAGIPVSVLVARWQMRTALAQAEASHRSTLEVTRQQIEAERDRWILDARRAEYRLFQNSLNQLRRAANIDPGTADGRLMLQVVGAMAEFERSLIKERTRAGLDAAKAQGRTGGRPSVVDEDVLTVARARKAKGESVSAIAKALGISRATLYRHLGESA